MNIVYQYLPVPPGGRFDLVIGTNIFLYYGAFEQSLAMANVAAMLKPGGYLLSNDKLPDWAGSGFGTASVTAIPMTGEPVIADYLYAYKRGS
jgi:predicted TPR repeat methyltransferase